MLNNAHYIFQIISMTDCSTNILIFQQAPWLSTALRAGRGKTRQKPRDNGESWWLFSTMEPHTVKAVYQSPSVVSVGPFRTSVGLVFRAAGNEVCRLWVSRKYNVSMNPVLLLSLRQRTGQDVPERAKQREPGPWQKSFSCENLWETGSVSQGVTGTYFLPQASSEDTNCCPVITFVHLGPTNWHYLQDSWPKSWAAHGHPDLCSNFLMGLSPLACEQHSSFL
jgi:hypothetical protein